jgi:type I restriction enzyme M protein
LNTEKRQLITALENLWSKYAVSSKALEDERSKTLKTLDSFMAGLGYLK